MYGMVNRALQQYVVGEAGESVWEDICREAGSPTTFSDSMAYDDDLTYRIVVATSERLDVPAPEILEGFGRQWVKFTGREGWGPVFDMAGTDLRSFVEGLDELHARVQASMPKSVMPTFHIYDRDDGVLEVEYRSKRDGLAPMVVGLLHGLADHFGEDWTVAHCGPSADGEGECFVLEPSNSLV